MHLGPAGPDETGPVGVVGDEEVVELDPVGGHPLLQLGDRPRALFGVAGEGPVIGVDPDLLVPSRLEWTSDDPRTVVVDG